MSNLKTFLRFQQRNDIKNMCVYNTLFMYNQFRKEGVKNVKFEYGFVEYIQGKYTDFAYHCWLSVNGKRVECSQQLIPKRGERVKYYPTLIQLCRGKNLQRELKLMLMKGFLELKKFETKYIQEDNTPKNEYLEFLNGGFNLKKVMYYQVEDTTITYY